MKLNNNRLSCMIKAISTYTRTCTHTHHTHARAHTCTQLNTEHSQACIYL